MNPEDRKFVRRIQGAQEETPIGWKDISPLQQRIVEIAEAVFTEISVGRDVYYLLMNHNPGQLWAVFPQARWTDPVWIEFRLTQGMFSGGQWFRSPSRRADPLLPGFARPLEDARLLPTLIKAFKQAKIRAATQHLTL
jgi:hypothetical protein